MKTLFNKRKKLLGKALLALGVFVIGFSFVDTATADVVTIVTTPTECERLGGNPIPLPGDTNVQCEYDDTAPPPTGGGGGVTDTGYTPEDQPMGTGGGGAEPVGECIKTAGPVPYGFNFTACAQGVAEIVLFIFSSAVALAGLLLDMAINITILQFKGWVNGVGAIRIAWELFRDALNITLIFVLLYAGIKMILGLGTPARILRGVIIAGLLINFSYFFTSIIIDMSNVATVEIHDAVKNIGDKVKGRGEILTYGGIAGAITQGLSPQETYRVVPPGSPDPADATSRDMAILIKMIFGIVLFLIVSIILGAIALLLFVRFIMLIVLLITSPIMVISDDLLPQLSSWRKKWWSELISQAVFAPILFLFIAITILIISDPKFGTFTPTLAANASFWENFFVDIASSLIQATIVVGILIVGLIVSKSFSGQLGGGITGWAEKKARSIATAPGRIAGGVAARGVASGARFVGGKYDVAAGRLSTQWKAAQKKLRDEAALPANAGIGRQAAYKTVLGGASMIGSLTGGADRGLRGTLKSAEGASVLGSETLADREKYERTRNTQLEQARRDAEAQKAIEEGLEETTTSLNNGTYTTDPGINAAMAEKINKFLSEVGKLSDKKIGEMLEENLSQFENEDFAAALNSRQMKKIMESDSSIVSDEMKDKIKKARTNGLARRMGSVYNTTTKTWNAPTRIDEAKKIITTASPEEIAALPADILTTRGISELLTPNTLGKLARDGKLDATKLATIRTNIEDAYTTPGAVISPELQKTMDWLTTGDGRYLI